MPTFRVDKAEREIQSKRANPRALVDWPVTLVSTKRSYQGRAANISRGGALIHLTEKLDVGDVVRLAFEVPEYQDVIVARGEILRVFPLEVVNEQQFHYGIALRFTDISDDNLKFFTGNLAPEWKEDYRDSCQLNNNISLPKANKNTPYLPWILVVILLIPLSYFVYDSIQRKVNDENLISEVKSKLLIIDEQINTLQNKINSMTPLEKQLNDLQLEVSDIKNRLIDADSLETITRQINNQINQIKSINQKIKYYNQDNLKSSTIYEQKEEKQQYYIVQKGDNLFQISSQNKISIQELKKINGIGPNEAIYPGQKIKLK